MATDHVVINRYNRPLLQNILSVHAPSLPEWSQPTTLIVFYMVVNNEYVRWGKNDVSHSLSHEQNKITALQFVSSNFYSL